MRASQRAVRVETRSHGAQVLERSATLFLGKASGIYAETRTLALQLLVARRPFPSERCCPARWQCRGERRGATRSPRSKKPIHADDIMS